MRIPLWLFSLVAASPNFCPGSNHPENDSFCNSAIIRQPPEPFNFVMSGSQKSTYAVNTLTNGTLYPAAKITFTPTVPTRVRIWDAYVSSDNFQLTLNNDLLPLQMPITPLIPRIWTPVFFEDNAFRNELYAWTEIILQNPSEWTLEISVERTYNVFGQNTFGTYVQQWIQTDPFTAPTSCPFN